MKRTPLSRRQLLGAGAAGLAGGLLPRRARAKSTVAPGDKRFVFILNLGGWDPLLVFTPMFGSSHIEMEIDAELSQAGNIPFVAHAKRPSVTRFFNIFHTRTLVWNGLLIPSVAHPPCQRAILTGYTHEAIIGDWATILGAAAADRFVLPSTLLSGPSFPGDHADIVCRAGSNGQLGKLLSGEIGSLLDVPVPAPAADREAAVDAFLAGRASRFAADAGGGREKLLADGFSRSTSRVASLKEHRDDVEWSRTANWDDQIGRTVEIFAAGLSRTVTMFFPYGSWDTHVSNDVNQTENYEQLFSGLITLMDALDTTPGTVGETLADEVIVVVLSEMGRTPIHNTAEGRDHWPYTTAMLVGHGFTGDRVVGELDDNYYGRPVDPTTGEVDDAGLEADPTTLGATLLALGDVDPADILPGAQVMDGLLGG